ILGFRQVQAEAEANHAGDDREGLRGSVLVLRSLIGLLRVLLLAELRPCQRLLGRVLPKVDSATQPIVVLLAPIEVLKTVYDAQGGGQAGPMIADHSSMVIVEAGHDVEAIRGPIGKRVRSRFCGLAST